MNKATMFNRIIKSKIRGWNRFKQSILQIINPFDENNWSCKNFYIILCSILQICQFELEKYLVTLIAVYS